LRDEVTSARIPPLEAIDELFDSERVRVLIDETNLLLVAICAVVSGAMSWISTFQMNFDRIRNMCYSCSVVICQRFILGSVNRPPRAAMQRAIKEPSLKDGSLSL
jgi:hypothetical protein